MDKGEFKVILGHMLLRYKHTHAPSITHRRSCHLLLYRAPPSYAVGMTIIFFRQFVPHSNYSAAIDVEAERKGLRSEIDENNRKNAEMMQST